MSPVTGIATMLTVYILSAIVGGGVVAASAFFGHGHEADLSHDVGGHDGSVEGHAADAHLWLPFLSLRFWTYTVAVFGVTGLLMTLLTGASSGAVAAISTLMGVGSGLAVSGLIRFLSKNESDSSMRPDDIMGVRGKLLVGCTESSDGKVRLNVKGEIIDLLALSQTAASLPADSEVVVVSMENDRAIVVAADELYG